MLGATNRFGQRGKCHRQSDRPVTFQPRSLLSEGHESALGELPHKKTLIKEACHHSLDER